MKFKPTVQGIDEVIASLRALRRKLLAAERKQGKGVAGKSGARSRRKKV